MDITSIIIAIISGAIGGNVIGTAAKQYSLGTAGNSIVGVIGGFAGGWILEQLFGAAPAADPAAAAAATGLDISQIIEQIAGGGIGGAILVIIAGIIKSSMAKT